MTIAETPLMRHSGAMRRARVAVIVSVCRHRALRRVTQEMQCLRHKHRVPENTGVLHMASAGARCTHRGVAGMGTPGRRVSCSSVPYSWAGGGGWKATRCSTVPSRVLGRPRTRPACCRSPAHRVAHSCTLASHVHACTWPEAGPLHIAPPRLPNIGTPVRICTTSAALGLPRLDSMAFLPSSVVARSTIVRTRWRATKRGGGWGAGGFGAGGKPCQHL